MKKQGVIIALCTSEKKGTGKSERESVMLLENHGLAGDAHGGVGHRQVSLLSLEKVDIFRQKGGKVNHGDFGENLLISGIDLAKLPVGTALTSGEVRLEITQIGKTCHQHCQIYEAVGDCIMPREGIFAKVLSGGELKKGDPIYVEDFLSSSNINGQ